MSKSYERELNAIIDRMMSPEFVLKRAEELLIASSSGALFVQIGIGDTCLVDRGRGQGKFNSEGVKTYDTLLLAYKARCRKNIRESKG
jgi:hypothetical protein